MLPAPSLDFPSMGVGYVAGLLSGIGLWFTKVFVATEYRMFRQRREERKKRKESWCRQTKERAVEARRAWSTYDTNSGGGAKSRLETLAVKLDQQAENAPDSVDDETLELLRETSRRCSNLGNWYGVDHEIGVEPYLSRVKRSGRELEETADDLAVKLDGARSEGR